MSNFRVYLPIVHIPDPYYGLAMAFGPDNDADLLGIGWRYNWGPTDFYPRARGQFVPMLWAGNPSSDVSYNYSGPILVMNEPDNINQANLSPSIAADRLRNVKLVYPYAKTIAPNCLAYNQDWLISFVGFGVVPDYYAVHPYIEGGFSVSDIIQKTEACHQITGGEYWITEYGSITGNVNEFCELTEWLILQPWIKRIAPYTNRQPATPFFEPFRELDMVNDAGTLRPCGRWYRDRISSAGQ